MKLLSTTAPSNLLSGRTNLGTTILSSNTTAISHTGTGPFDLMTYTIPANTFNANGQTVSIDAVYSIDNYVTGGDCEFNILGSNYEVVAWAEGPLQVWCLISLTRLSSSTLSIQLLSGENGGGIQSSGGIASAVNFTVTTPIKSTFTTSDSGETFSQRLMNIYFNPVTN